LDLREIGRGGGFTWLRIRTVGGLLWTRWWTSELVSCLLCVLPSEGLCSVNFFNGKWFDALQEVKDRKLSTSHTRGLIISQAEFCTNAVRTLQRDVLGNLLWKGIYGSGIQCWTKKSACLPALECSVSWSSKACSIKHSATSAVSSFFSSYF
jgi:hypothetical protein